MHTFLNSRLFRVRLGIFFCLTDLLGISVPYALSATTHPDPKVIVEKADLIRFPSDAFQVNVKVTSTVDDNNPEIRVYRVLTKGNDKSLIMTLEPPIEKGQILLMRESSLWAFMPNVSQPIRLPLAQKLIGQVANGDLARAKFSGDYDPKLQGIETINGNNYYVLELIAKNRSVTYHRVVYWVNTANYHPYKAEFYSLSNRLLKTCEYSEFKKMEGISRPTRLIMTDALRRGEHSVLDYTKMMTRNIPDKVFTKDYLKKLF